MTSSSIWSSRSAPGVPGRGEYLNEKVRSEIHLANKRERLLEISNRLAGKADDEIGRERDVRTHGAKAPNDVEIIFRACGGGSSLSALGPSRTARADERKA